MPLATQVADLEQDHEAAKAELTSLRATIDALRGDNELLRSENTALMAKNAELLAFATNSREMCEAVATKALDMLRATRQDVFTTMVSAVTRKMIADLPQGAVQTAEGWIPSTTPERITLATGDVLKPDEIEADHLPLPSFLGTRAA